MRIPRPAAEKLGAGRQDPYLDGLLFGLMSRATGGCHDHEHAARADHPQVSGGPRGRKKVKPYTIGIQNILVLDEMSPNTIAATAHRPRARAQATTVKYAPSIPHKVHTALPPPLP